MIGVTMTRAEWIGAAIVACLILLTVWFVILDSRAMARRPLLHGSGGRYGRRSSTIWFLFALITGMAAYGLIRFIWFGN